LPDDKADALVVRLNEAASGRVAWVGEPDNQPVLDA
jgi:hypothetical protein